jgi:nucleoside-diphosphate-sugar epimerase
MCAATWPGDIRHSLADINRARGLGYSPDYGLEDALKETIRWFGRKESSS